MFFIFLVLIFIAFFFFKLCKFLNELLNSINGNLKEIKLDVNRLSKDINDFCYDEEFWGELNENICSE